MRPEERAGQVWQALEAAVNREQEETIIAAALREAVAENQARLLWVMEHHGVSPNVVRRMKAELAKEG